MGPGRSHVAVPGARAAPGLWLRDVHGRDDRPPAARPRVRPGRRPAGLGRAGRHLWASGALERRTQHRDLYLPALAGVVPLRPLPTCRRGATTLRSVSTSRPAGRVTADTSRLTITPHSGCEGPA